MGLPGAHGRSAQGRADCSATLQSKGARGRVEGPGMGGGFSEGATEGEVVLQEVKAAEDTALLAFLPKQSSPGFPALPKGGQAHAPSSLTSPGSPGSPALGSDRQDFSIFATCPHRALSPGLLASGCHLSASTQAAHSGLKHCLHL